MWKNNTKTITTTVPVCSDRCTKALGVLYGDPIGKNLKCCICEKFSDIDQSNLNALKKLELCKSSRLNLENICKVSQTFGCDPPNTFQGKQ